MTVDFSKLYLDLLIGSRVEKKIHLSLKWRQVFFLNELSFMAFVLNDVIRYSYPGTSGLNSYLAKNLNNIQKYGIV